MLKCGFVPPQGLIFAAAGNHGIIRLYDSKNYQAGPFSTFVVSRPARCKLPSRLT